VATKTDVAKRAGVSLKTVSRVMNGYQHVSAKMRGRVQAAMDELGYVPNGGRGAALGPSPQSIGMLYDDPSGGYQTALNEALLKACQKAGRYLAVEYFDQDHPQWRDQLSDYLGRTQVNKLILVPPMCDSTELLLCLRERGIDTVLISPSRQISGAIAIAVDDRLAAMEMTKHLIDLGHENIGHISGDSGHVATVLRRQGFEEAMKTAGLSLGASSVMAAGKFSFKSALSCAEDMLSLPDRPSAIFAGNDEMAAAVIMAANRIGIAVPEDLSVAGFDNSKISRTIWPELTTVAQPFDLIAHEAVRLVSRGGAQTAEVSATRVLPHKILFRASSGPRAR